MIPNYIRKLRALCSSSKFSYISKADFKNFFLQIEWAEDAQGDERDLKPLLNALQDSLMANVALSSYYLNLHGKKCFCWAQGLPMVSSKQQTDSLLLLIQSDCRSLETFLEKFYQEAVLLLALADQLNSREAEFSPRKRTEKPVLESTVDYLNRLLSFLELILDILREQQKDLSFFRSCLQHDPVKSAAYSLAFRQIETKQLWHRCSRIMQAFFDASV